ncbi:2-succinylbenzoate--CoA ligase [Argonema galeatum]|uniref:2-succinylbenzoate--CoA ligase n=1 Tax=Argonema galeatum TaxID=2942762 RepID=UPI0020120749|nr:2-succinylbenzoate--CoA ligase [Argonema galeatum]MCL1466209.1 2-succinylbenzoate--CoA ligase [Argonema galeatum A003/A1]
MEQPLVNLPDLDLVGWASRLPDDWLIGYDSRQFTQLAEQLYLELIQLSHRQTSPKIIIADRNPVRFLAGFIAATAADCPVFLCNPDWVKAEWQQVFDLVQPDIIWGQEAISNKQEGNCPIQNPKSKIQNRIMVPTGGSSGQIRFTIHTWATLTASVQGFTQYFHLDRVNSFCVLPLYHVSGLMQFMRSFITGGKLAILPFKALENVQKCHIETADFFISLVPTQLERLLHHSPAWLSRFQTVLLGGAPAWHELLEQAKHHRIPLALTYGMTETASQIVTLKPEDFLKGNNSCGQVLPHAKVMICTPDGKILGANETGIVTIQADSLALGYYPDSLFVSSPLSVENHYLKKIIFQPDDLGFFDDRGYLNIVGRSSNKIITGGENVFPFEVEAAIRSTNLVSDVCVIGLPDRHWGQAVTAVYVPINPEVNIDTLKTALDDKLSKFKRPKYWVSVEKLPRNAQGKVNGEKIQQIAMLWHQHHSNLATNQ